MATRPARASASPPPPTVISRGAKVRAPALCIPLPCQGRGAQFELRRSPRATRRGLSREGEVMEAFTKLTAGAVPMDLPNIDTDRVIPARFLQKSKESGLGKYFFHDVRFNPDGSEN